MCCRAGEKEVQRNDCQRHTAGHLKKEKKRKKRKKRKKKKKKKKKKRKQKNKKSHVASNLAKQLPYFYSVQLYYFDFKLHAAPRLPGRLPCRYPFVVGSASIYLYCVVYIVETTAYTDRKHNTFFIPCSPSLHS